MPVIEVEGLRKRYGAIAAVDGVNFQVDRGEVFGMLGPNGAGKTTTVEILEGLRPRDGGTVRVLGLDPSHAARAIKARIGVQLQQVALFPDLKVPEIIELFASFYGRGGVAGGLIERLGLQERRTARVKELSGGQQQRLSVALAAVNDPELVFLDEPTTGMDPQARRNLWGVVEQFKSEGRTVFLTTHYMEEAERLCDRVAVMDHGRIIALDAPGRLVRAHFNEDAIEFAQCDGLSTDDLRPLPEVTSAALEGDRFAVFSARVPETMAALLDLARARKLPLEDLRVRHATLEDVFLKLTGRTLRD
ncbi:MAG: ABC transporter ATP-binding protein [Actinobacteria bacterium]|nr:ABC transporter ATP-binding protein [Actinomycetota bacterium]